MFIPGKWPEGTERRARTGMPEEAGTARTWRLTLDLIDETIAWAWS
ncbi:hypothetical protein ACIRBX_16645 [Kitasatospora sp. NPDC096147]